MSEQGKIKFEFDDSSYKTAKLAVLGVGGAGGNAVGTMAENSVENVTLMAANTDLQVLERMRIPVTIQLGPNCTRGLGAGGNPNMGMEAAEESLKEIEEQIRDVDMLFITAGMGGGTGTGAAPIIAAKAREMGILTVGIVTKPFRFEGPKRGKLAEQGLNNLKDNVNTLVVIPNQKLLEMEEVDLPAMEAFKKADEVLVNAVRGISDLITTAGYVNVDFADVKTIMSSMGMAIMGTGIASGPERALEAARQAITSPLLDNLNINGAKGVLVNITGSRSLTLREVDAAVGYIQESADPEADFIFGYVTDENMGDNVKVTVIATGFEYDARRGLRERVKPLGYEERDRNTRDGMNGIFRPQAQPLEMDRDDDLMAVRRNIERERIERMDRNERLDRMERSIDRPREIEPETERRVRIPSINDSINQSFPEIDDAILIPSYRRRQARDKSHDVL